MGNGTEQHLRDIQPLLQLNRNELSQKTKDEILDITILIGRTLLAHMAKMIGPREAAEMFNKKKTWIYDALNRPRTQLQLDVAKVVRREGGGLILFQVSDLVVIREIHLAVRDANA